MINCPQSNQKQRIVCQTHCLSFLILLVRRVLSRYCVRLSDYRSGFRESDCCNSTALLAFTFSYCFVPALVFAT